MATRWKGWPRTQRMRVTEHPTPDCRRILAVLRDAGVEVPGPDGMWRICRTHAGHWQRSEGAWSWFLEWAGEHDCQTRALDVGSYWPARLCGKAGSVVQEGTHGRIELMPPRPAPAVAPDREQGA